jgi:hypothetical protein
MPFRTSGVYPDTSGIDQAERQAVAWSYSGILAAEPVVIRVVLQNIAWDILKENSQDISWSIFAKTLYFIQQFFVNPIALDFEIIPGQIIPWPGLNLPNDYTINSPVKYDFTVKQPVNFDIYLSTVLQGEEDTIDRG